MRDKFVRFAAKVSELAGSYWTFIIALVIILTWAISGPFMGFSTTWQLVINTFTTLVTFLMVFIIQNTQNREGRATQLKLDEIIDSMERADDALIDIEESTDEELKRLAEVYRRQGTLARLAEVELAKRRMEADVSEERHADEG